MNSDLRSVLVTQSTPGRTSVHGELSFGTSGVLLADGWILSHGSLLSPNFFEAGTHEIRDFLLAVQEEFERDVVAVPRAVADTMRFRLQYNEEVAGDEVDSRSSQKKIVEKDCSLKAVWRCSLLRKTFNGLLFSWSFEKVAKFDKSLLSIFLLLRVNNAAKIGDHDATEGRRILRQFYTASFGPSSARVALRRGATVEIESAPFGNAVFLESVSRGVVSNVLGEGGCVVLVDANAVPGCEGAPLYLLDEHSSSSRNAARLRICGLVIAPLSWCRGEWVDYTFAANLQACLRKILRAPDTNGPAALLTSPPIGDGESPPPLLPDLLDRSVVVVKCGSGWGTGVVVDVPTGTIITCSHVVREAPGSSVKISLGESRDWARLVYRTRDGQPFDVAVLRLEGKHENLKALTLASEAPARGTAVMTAGYPFFSSSSSSWSRGVVSRLGPCMLQTTCCVQSGASGGPVVDCRTGQMLGLIVSNAVSTGSEYAALYPRFNMSVPATVLCRPLLDYARTGDVKCLESLSSSDPLAQETWNFYLTPRSKM